MILLNGQPAGLSLTQDNKAPRGWPCTLQEKARSQHKHGAPCRGEQTSLESKCAILTCSTAHMQFSFFIFQCCLCQEHYWDQTHAGVQKKHIGTKCCNAMARYTEYQSIALPFQHEWWFSRSTFRWGEQEVSAGWFSTSISYNGGHFSPHRMTYEGKATALISILLWRMVAKVSYYLFSICCV